MIFYANGMNTPKEGAEKTVRQLEELQGQKVG